jgi:hypothetical protein
MVTEIVPTASLDFNKEDIAAIAIAEAEVKMRETFNTVRNQISDLEKAIEEINDEIRILGEDAISKKTESTLKNINAGLKVTKIKNIEVQLSKSVENDQNRYSITIILKDKDRVLSQMIVEKDSFPFIQTQTTALKKYFKLEDQKKQLNNEAMNWRRKLADMPMLERQIRAKLARNQIEKTKEGRAMIDELVKNFDQTVKLLGQ